MLNKESNRVERVLDSEGKEHVVALECEIRGRKFIITTDKKIFEKDAEDVIRECTKQDEETKFLSKYLQEPKSLDIEL